MSQPLVLVLIAMLGITGTLTGVWLGSRLTRRNEDRKWRRDQALEAYSDFLHALEMVISESGTAYGTPCGTEKHGKQCQIVYDRVLDMHRTSSRIILLGSDAVQPSFSALIGNTGTELLMMSIQCPKISVDERKAANTKLSKLMATFLVIARQDIGIHPSLEMPKKRWWARSS